MGMVASPTIRLVPFDEKYLERSWHWLNDPEIKKLTMAPDFTRQDQRRFFASLSGRQDYHVWGVEALSGEPIGAGGIKNVVGRTGEFWCYIGERDWWGKGAGGEILDLCIAKAKTLGLNRLLMVAASDNERSLRAYIKAGFGPLEAQPHAGKIWLGLAI